MVIFFSIPSLQGQIKVSSDGKINMGTTGEMCPNNYKVYSDGSVYINGMATLNSLHFNPSVNATIWGPFDVEGSNYNTLRFEEDAYGDIGIIPSGLLGGTLGSSDEQFFRIYGYQIYLNHSPLVSSDERIKTNMSKIESPLNKILKMKGHKYDYKFDQEALVKSGKKKDEVRQRNKNHLGFMAQELMGVVPEAVSYDEDNDKYYIDYNAIIPVLVEAMKEQQAKIETLEARLDKLEGKSQEKSATVFTGSQTIDAANVPTLAQNIPNPFSTSTRIDISLPQTVNNARLYVYNMQGAQIKSFNVSQRGATSVTIEGFTLDAGMYLYTLIADGKEVDTKKMILTK